MLCHTGGITQANVQHSEPMSTPQVNQTTKRSTTVQPTGGAQDSPTSGQQEGHLFCTLIILIRFLTNFPSQF